jgi:2-C-methyl-D-erythritol 4-phosphate cytidylyltransferase
LKAGTRKANLKLGSKMIFEWPLLSLLKSPLIAEVALVVHPRDLQVRKAWATRQRFKKPVYVVAGGKERQDSVGLGIQALDPRLGLLLVHDAARPFLKARLIGETLKLADRHGAALAAVPVKDSIKLLSRGKNLKALPRERLLAAQTPQAASTSTLRAAHAWARKAKKIFTDEASLLEARGQASVAAAGYYENFKITTPEDMVNARLVIKTFRFDR